MQGTLQIAKWFDIPIKMHWSFALLPLMVLYNQFQIGANWTSIAWMLTFVATLFLCVVLHEYGHALMAKRFNVHTIDIILSPIGGIARLEGLPKRPSEELAVAIAGPLVNFLIVLLLIPILVWQHGTDFWAINYLYNNQIDASDFLAKLLLLNLILAIFNLLPAFPMDGGRILRAGLSFLTNRKKATFIASRIGQLIAVGFIAFGLWSGAIVTMLVGGFVFLMAGQEYKAVKQEVLLETTTAAAIMTKEKAIIQLDASPDELFDKYKNDHQNNFMVYDGQQFIGLIMENQLKKLKETTPSSSNIFSFISTTPIFVSTTTSLNTIIELMRTHKLLAIPVIKQQKVVGLIEIDTINAFIEKL